MSNSWNVKDTEVFDELAMGLRETEWMTKEIDSEANAVLNKTIQNCEQAKGSLRSEITATEIKIEELKRKRSELLRNNASTLQIDAEIRAKECELMACREDMARIEKAENDLTDSKRAYDASFSEKNQVYTDSVEKACRLLNHFGIMLTQSRLGL